MKNSADDWERKSAAAFALFKRRRGNALQRSRLLIGIA
jgi:hypothetical protein